MSLQELLAITIKVSLWAMAASIGLHSTPGQLLKVFTRPVLLARVVLAVNVVVPLAAMAVIAALPLLPIVKAGILLMAVSPAAPFVPANAAKAGGDRADSYALYTALVLLSAVLVPVTVALISRAYGLRIALPPLVVLQRFAEDVMLPMAVGLLVHRLAPRTSERISVAANRAGTALLLAAAAPIFVLAGPQMWALVGHGTILAIVLVCLAALAGGHLISGRDRRARGALAMAAVYRHPGVAIIVASAARTDRSVIAVILTYLLVGMLMGLAYRAWLQRTARTGPAAEAGPKAPRMRGGQPGGPDGSCPLGDRRRDRA